jgi:hypothetical protein
MKTSSLCLDGTGKMTSASKLGPPTPSKPRSVPMNAAFTIDDAVSVTLTSNNSIINVIGQYVLHI